MVRFRTTYSRATLAAVTAGGLLVAAAISTAVASAAEGDDPPAAAPLIGEANERQQVAEKGASTGKALTTSAGQVCAPAGAKWLRVRVAKLDLRGTDSLVVSGATGDSTRLTATNWQGKAFHTKAFSGSCVTVTPKLKDPASSYSIDAYQSGTQPLSLATVTVAGAGDICGSACNQTRDLLDSINPDAVYTAGDNAYESGTLSEYNNNYHPEWGAYKSITHPTPGNHEYGTSGASGYFSYFGSAAGQSGKGYYSWDIGDWHFVALNSNISKSAGSAQEVWLRNDLAASTKPCTAAYWHHSRFAAGNYSDDSSLKPFFQALYDYHADLVLSGHDHNYIRFAQSKPDGTKDTANGIRQLLVGTGGRALYGSGGSTAATIEKSNYNTFGVAKLTLNSTGYTADFVPVAGRTFTDTVTSNCHAKTGSSTPSYTVSASPSSVSVARGASRTSTVTVASSGGFNAATNLTVSGLPAGVTGSFNPSSVTPPANGTATSTLTLTASATATTGATTVTVTGTSGTATKTAAIALDVTSGGNVLSNGVPVTGLSGAQGAVLKYTLAVPAGATNLKFVTAGGSGDADLYVKFGSEPTTSSYDCRPYKDGNDETCTFSTAQAGTYYVMIRGYAAFSGLSLTGSHS
ncbi:pre-peptidase C-terminal domain-containing protein [Kribbella sp. NPDC056951]|uniref:pre-peptidase C-terminal domain-containing protein n=1 Tax=Kribbella sp. NPDC056951 TaxID=3345978 RepID=UPI00363B36BC